MSVGNCEVVPREELKEYRISINKTQNQMAEKWGITLSFYKQIELRIKKSKYTENKRF